MQTDECLLDAWNYLDRPCGNSTWITGSSLYIGDFKDDDQGYPGAKLTENTNQCDGTVVGCPGFESKEEMAGKYDN